MMGFCSEIQRVFSTGGEWLGWFLGGYDDLLYALFIFIIVDIITGVMCAAVDKKLSIKIGVKGIAKKGLIILMVGISRILDMQVVIGIGSALRMMIILFYISNEGASILRNVTYLGLPVPEKLKKLLELLHER